MRPGSAIALLVLLAAIIAGAAIQLVLGGR